MTPEKLDELERLWAEVQKREPGYGFAKIALDKLLADALPELVARVRELERIETAARVYYENYLKDEAAEDGVEMTGCSEHQHALAYDLRLALKGTPT